MPVCFDDQPKDVSDGIDFDNISLGEAQVEDLPSELWTSDLESLFLPKEAPAVVAPIRRKSFATSSIILTSSEIIQAKKEKAIEAIERKVRAEETKQIVEHKKQTKMVKIKGKKKLRVTSETKTEEK